MSSEDHATVKKKTRGDHTEKGEVQNQKSTRK